MTNAPFGKVPGWLGGQNCPLIGAVEYALMAILGAKRAVRRTRVIYMGVEIILEQGHVCVSQRELAKLLKVDRQRIRTAIKRFQKMQILNPPKNPQTNPANGPAPDVFFFNVNMQLDVFGTLHQPIIKPKVKPTDQPTANPVLTQQKPRLLDDKMFRKGGDAPARETEPQAQPPPPLVDDQLKNKRTDPPEKTPVPEVLPDEWAGIARNEFRDVDGLNPNGEHKLSRSFKRFRNHNAGEKFKPEKWLGRWRNWLLDDFEPVDSHVSTPTTNKQANGAAADANGHDTPASADLAPGMGLADFANLVIGEFDRFMKINGLDFMTLLERSDIKTSAYDIKLGRTDKVGLERTGYWDAAEITKRLGLTPKEKTEG